MGQLFEDRPRWLKCEDERKRRSAMLSQPHILPLTEHVTSLRKELGNGWYVPDFDPLDGGKKVWGPAERRLAMLPVKIDGGTVTVAGFDIFRQSLDARRRIGYLRVLSFPEGAAGAVRDALGQGAGFREALDVRRRVAIDARPRIDRPSALVHRLQRAFAALGVAGAAIQVAVAADQRQEEIEIAELVHEPLGEVGVGEAEIIP